LLRRLTRIIVNSNYTAGDVAKYIRANPDIGANIAISVVPLAHEFNGDATQLDFFERRELSFLTRLPYVLVVGTANARKNAWAAAYVWNAIRESLGPKTPRIIFVDRDIFLNEPFRNLMEATKNIYGLAEFVKAPTDTQLAFLYEHCLFTIYPSLYEGWGLPVGESIWMKKPVVAAKATSIPEVGGAFVDYFDPGDLQSLHDICLKLICDEEYRQSRVQNLAQKNLRRWTTVISETIDAIEGVDLKGDDAQKLTSKPAQLIH
jgi:glycosyltransferase involved in cell wall biosynthesis